MSQNRSGPPWGPIAVLVIFVLAVGVLYGVSQARETGKALEKIKPLEALDYCEPKRMAIEDEAMTATFQVDLMASQQGKMQESTASFYRQVLSTDKNSTLDKKLGELDQAIVDSVETGNWDLPKSLAAEIDGKVKEYCKA